MCVCGCVCVCMRTCVCVRVHVRVCTCMRIVCADNDVYWYYTDSGYVVENRKQKGVSVIVFAEGLIKLGYNYLYSAGCVGLDHVTYTFKDCICTLQL